MNRYSIDYLDRFTTKKGRTSITKEDIAELIESGKRFDGSIVDIIIQIFWSIHTIQSYKFFTSRFTLERKSEIENRILENKSQFKWSRETAQEAEDSAVKLKAKDIRESDLKCYYEINNLVDEAFDDLKNYSCDDNEKDLIAKIKCIQEIVQGKVDRFKNKEF